MSIAPNPDRSVFYGFGGWVGSLLGPTICGWWPDDPNDAAIKFDPKKQIIVDLAKNPQAHLRQTLPVDQIEVDDSLANGGGTALGPTWPTGSTINTIFLSSTFWDKLASQGLQPPRTPKGGDCYDYELTSVLYWAGVYAKRRFWGVHAEITQTRGTLGLTSISPRGKSRVAGIAPFGSFWIDYTAALPIEPGLTQIGIAPGDPKKGALFLDSTTTASIGLFWKTPWYYGAVAAR